ncbi:ATP-dependent nuclease [Arthrobacter alpinus]|uniref:ATP-dependent nuclease n=1 Tax=Arthrobacter alpinus TaxID=656366 RepID=UPI00147E4904|nr:AAA family ATPase [Arthrobacter alpinus]
MIAIEQEVHKIGGIVRVCRFSIWNHNRIQDATIEVGRHLVIVGPNDVGKSSILRCLDLALGSSTGALYQKLTIADFRDTRQPLTIEVVLTGISMVDRELFPDEINVDPQTSAETLRVRLDVEADDLGTLSIRRTAPDGATGRQISRDQLLGLGWTTLSATQTSFRDFRDEKNPSVASILASVDLGEEAVIFKDISESMQSQLDDSIILRDLRTRISGQLSKALPAKLEHGDLSFVSNASSDPFAEVRLQFKSADGVRTFSEMSDGSRALYAMALFDLVASSASIVAIDEPEVHLHPASQRSLARLLESGQTQKIIATHSPDVVAMFAVDEILVVKPGGKMVQAKRGVFSNDESMKLRWWVPNKLKPLTARKVVIVEGISDDVILRKVGELTARSIEQLGVTSLPLGGGGEVKPVFKLFGPNGFDIDMAILIDRDAVGATELHTSTTEADFGTQSIFVSEPDLEGEYVRAIGSEVLYKALCDSALFSKGRLSSLAMVAGTAFPSDYDLSAFCRLRGNKVDSALVASQVLTPETAAKVHSVHRLLDDLVSVGDA